MAQKIRVSARLVNFEKLEIVEDKNSKIEINISDLIRFENSAAQFEKVQKELEKILDKFAGQSI